MEFTRGNKRFILLARPFWTSHAFDIGGGLVGVARVDARSANLRYRKKVGDYWTTNYIVGTIEDGYDGDYAHYMLDLTQDELDAIRSAPGYAELPQPDFCNSVDGARPKTNDPALKISSTREQFKIYDDLQSEGNREPEFVDNTPYQKGDDLP